MSQVEELVSSVPGRTCKPGNAIDKKIQAFISPVIDYD